MLRRWFQRRVLSRLWATYLCLGLAFFVFGAGTLNLFFLLKANADLLWRHGWQAVMDGGLQQLLELLFSGYVAMAAYIVFKACEHRLVHWLHDA
jgi:predicted PurR-regulated permease PerM